MESLQQVVVTGLGIISSCGLGTDAFWASLLSGKSGIQRITRFDPSPFPCQIGGEVHDRAYEDVLEPRTLRTTAHVSQLACAAAKMALEDAHLPPGTYEPEGIGVCLGTALGGTREAEQQHSILMERGVRRVNPFLTNGSLNHAPVCEVATICDAQGPQATFSTGCTSSLQAIGYGTTLVASGELDLCLAGGAESPLTPMVIAGMSRTAELSTVNDSPAQACCPFDQRHNGLVLSEGACFLVLERADQATERGVRPYAQVRGFSSTCDARGMYTLDPSGRAAALGIYRVLQHTALQPTDVDYVCAHANSAPAFDRKETVVLKAAFGELACRLPVSSIKGVLGHAFGASGAFQAAAAALAIRNQLIPPTHNLWVPDPECDLDYVPLEARTARLRNCLVTSYGYGGTNAYLVLAES